MQLIKWKRLRNTEWKAAFGCWSLKSKYSIKIYMFVKPLYLITISCTADRIKIFQLMDIVLPLFIKYILELYRLRLRQRDNALQVEHIFSLATTLIDLICTHKTESVCGKRVLYKLIYVVIKYIKVKCNIPCDSISYALHFHITPVCRYLNYWIIPYGIDWYE